MSTYLLAGGGTAGHVNPLLALADEIRRNEPDANIIALGTAEGLEARLVPERGYELVTIARLPFPRKIGRYAFEFPKKYLETKSFVKRLLVERKVDAVIGFGGYASAPAYDAAKSLNIPYGIHEANALPGMANRKGAPGASFVAVTFPETKLSKAQVTGMPLRREIEALLKGVDKASARKSFGLAPDVATILVTGGSLGAKRLNETIEASRAVLKAAGVQVLHIMGNRSELPEVAEPGYVRIAYCDQMELAIASADLAVSRSGAATVSEFSAIGLPAVYVPYPVGNGEQALNAAAAVSAEAALLVKDAEFTPEYVSATVVPLISDSKRIARMSASATLVGISDGTKRLYELVTALVR